VAISGDTLCYGRDLRWRLAQSEHDLREALANRPVMVNSRESNIFVWSFAQIVEQLLVCVVDVDVTSMNLFE
jgi:hypothetical protein